MSISTVLTITLLDDEASSPSQGTVAALSQAGVLALVWERRDIVIHRCIAIQAACL